MWHTKNRIKVEKEHKQKKGEGRTACSSRALCDDLVCCAAALKLWQPPATELPSLA